jgi:hypothetical protein
MSIAVFRKKPDPFDYEVSRICKACGTMFHGRFCNRCGEKVFEPHERSILNFLDSVLNAFTFLDGKFLKSLKLLITRPGQLSRNIADGIRTPYMKMVSLFFVANFFYFIIPTWDSFNSSLYSQMHSLGRNEKAARMVNERLEKEHITIEQFREKYQAESTNLSKMLLVLLALMFTIVLMVVCFARKFYFFDHLLFSMEFFSFHILVNLLVLTYFFFGIIKVGDRVGFNARFLVTDQVFSMITWVTMGYFLIRGLMTFYGQKWYGAAIRAVVLYFLLQFVVDVYRGMLFYYTMWMI